MDTIKIIKGIDKVNEILTELKSLKAEQNKYANDYYYNGGGYEALEKACSLLNKIGYIEGGLYRRMKNLIRGYYDDRCEWLDSKVTNYGRDNDLKLLNMYRELKHTFHFWNVVIVEF